MEIIYPAFQDALREPDPSFQKEWEAAEELGLRWHVFDFEALIAGNFQRAFRFLRPGAGQTVLYRGWILKEAEYENLGRELQLRGYSLFTSTKAYANANYFPNYYEKIINLTPPAVWVAGVDFRQAWMKAKELGEPPYIIKDYVKSAKELWNEACYIPANASKSKFYDACRRLVKYRGDGFERGIVIRPYVPLRFLDDNPFGSQPIFEEYRLFFLNGSLFWTSAYDRVGGDHTDFSKFLSLGDSIDSPFFTADIARTADGDLILIELGDGCVSSLPPSVLRIQFYKKLAELLQSF